MRVGLVILGAVGVVLSSSLAGSFHKALIDNVVNKAWNKFKEDMNKEVNALLSGNELGNRVVDILKNFGGKLLKFEAGVIHDSCGKLSSSEEKIQCYNEGFLSAFRHYGRVYYDNLLKGYNSPKSYEDLVKGFQAWYLGAGFDKIFEAGKSYSYIESPDVRVDAYYMPKEVKELYYAFIVKQAQREALIKALAKEYELYVESGEESVKEMEREVSSLEGMEQDLVANINQVINRFLSGIGAGGLIGPIVNALMSSFTGLANTTLEQTRHETRIKGKELAFDVAKEKREIKRDALEGKVNLATLSFMNALISNMEMEMLRRETELRRLVLEEKVRKDLEKIKE